MKCWRVIMRQFRACRATAIFGDFNGLFISSSRNTLKISISQVEELSLTPEELDRLKESVKKEIDASLTKLNNDIYQNEKAWRKRPCLSRCRRHHRHHRYTRKKLPPLEKSDLKSSNERGWRDGGILVRKIESFLEEKALPKEKERDDFTHIVQYPSNRKHQQSS